MVLTLRLFFAFVLAAIVGATTWASFQAPLLGVPREVVTHPWFLATLVDAYLAFLTFYAWVAWRETTWLGRLSWLVAILLLGNIAMALYCLERLFSVPRDAKAAEIFLHKRTAPSWSGVILALAGAALWTLLA